MTTALKVYDFSTGPAWRWECDDCGINGRWQHVSRTDEESAHSRAQSAAARHERAHTLLSTRKP